MTLAFLVLVGAGTSPLAAVAVVAVAAAVVAAVVAAAVVVVVAAVVAAAVVGCVVVVEVAIDYSRHLNHSTSADLVSISY